MIPWCRWLHSWSRDFADFGGPSISASASSPDANRRSRTLRGGILTLAQRERAGEGLEAGCQERRPRGAAAIELTATEEEVSVEAKVERDGGEGLAVHEGGAPGGEEAFILVRVAVVQEAADGQADDGVAVELEALVVASDDAGILVEVRAVDECLTDQLRVTKNDAEPLAQLVGERSFHGRCAGY